MQHRENCLAARHLFRDFCLPAACLQVELLPYLAKLTNPMRNHSKSTHTDSAGPGSAEPDPCGPSFSGSGLEPSKSEQLDERPQTRPSPEVDLLWRGFTCSFCGFDLRNVAFITSVTQTLHLSLSTDHLHPGSGSDVTEETPFQVQHPTFSLTDPLQNLWDDGERHLDRSE